jgi:putative spermidine/putrescine transport system permease protein
MKAREWPGGLLLLGPACLWLGAFFLIPLVLMLRLSFYAFLPMGGIQEALQVANYVKVFTDSYYLGIFLRTIRISLLVTLFALLLGYPEAYYLTQLRGRAKALVLIAVLSPLIVSAVTRTFGWFILLANNGLVNNLILALGLSDTPVKLIYSETGIVIGLTHVLVPFMVLSIYAALQRRDPSLVRAAETLGASPLRTFLEVTLPLSLPGIVAGSVLVFTLAMSAFVTPAILGGTRVRVVAYLVYEEFLLSLNWPFGAALALILVLFTMTVVVGYHRWLERGRWGGVFR